MALTARLAHFGIHADDLGRMVDFYTRIMGFGISDQGTARSGTNIVFMSREAWVDEVQGRLGARP